MASAQQGIITAAQLMAAGIRRGAIAHWVASGRLYRRYRGVFILGRPTLEPLGAEWAAVLACAGRGALDGLSALSLWGVIERASAVPSVTVVGRDSRSRPGITVHRSITLTPDELRIRHGLPVTAPARSILDAAPAPR